MLYAIVAVIALIIDQAVKFWATANIPLNTGVKEFIPGFIQFTNIHNTGAAFSILEGARWFFVVLCILFVTLIIYVLVTDIITAPGSRWMAVIVMAGAVGNCIDRIICGYVVDMIEFEFMNFPVFNVADIYITVGAILFVVFTLLEKPAKVPAKAGAAEAAGSKEAKTGFSLPIGRKKTPIPEFPKREHKVEPVSVDPGDPFAEWERRAGEIRAANENKPQSDIPTQSYVKPEPPKAQPKPAAQPVAEAPKAPARPAVSYPAVSAEPAAPVAPKAPVAPAAAAPAAASKAAPAAPAAAPKAAPAQVEDDFDFDLDSIMAEFRDL